MNRHPTVLITSILLLCITFSAFGQMKTGHSMKDFDRVFHLRPGDRFTAVMESVDIPGGVLFPGDRPAFTFRIEAADAASVSATGRVELIPYGTRGIPGDIWLPEVFAKEAIQAIPIEVDLPPGGTRSFTVHPDVPETKGGYALVVDLGEQGRQFLTTFVRTFRASPERIQYPKQSLDGAIPPAILERLGIQAIRLGVRASSVKDEQYLQKLHEELAELHAHRVTAVVEFGAGSLPQPLGRPRPHLDENGRMLATKSDMAWLPEHDDEFAEFVYHLVSTYGWPRGPITGAMLWNEPWEGISISGWGADMIRYRTLYKTMGDAVFRARQEANVDVLLGCCDSSSNTWDKLFPDGSDEFLPYLDFASIHYQGLSAPVLYPEWNDRTFHKGRVRIWDTESWVANTDDRIAGVVATNRASGYDRALGVFIGNVATISNHGQRQFPGPVMTWPPAASIGAVQHFLGERSFRQILFKNGLPWVYLFDGLDGDPDDGTLVVIGDIGALFDPDMALFRSVDRVPDATLAIDAAEAFTLYDFYGNPVAPVDGQISVPLDDRGFYLRADPDRPGSFAALVDAVRRARIEGIEPLEMIPRDPTAPIEDGPILRLTCTNVLNRAIAGKLEIELKGLEVEQPPRLRFAPHETRQIELKIAGGRPVASNTYPLALTFDAGEDGTAKHLEEIHVNYIAHRHIDIDGRLEDWRDVLPQTISTDRAATRTLTEAAWLPFEQFDPGKVGGFATGYLAYDDDYFYFAARIADATPHPGTLRFSDRDDDPFFYPEESIDSEGGRHRWPQGVRRFSYRRNPILPSGSASRFDNVQIGFNAIPMGEDGWETHLPGRMPKFIWYKCTDYEYALNKVAEEYGGGYEVWRLQIPGMPKKHFYPRQPAHPLEGAVTEARMVTLYRDSFRITEAAIPWSELPHVRRLLDAGEPVKFSFRVNDDAGGPTMELAKGRGVSKRNNRAFQTDWSESWANELEFGWEK